MEISTKEVGIVEDSMGTTNGVEGVPTSFLYVNESVSETFGYTMRANSNTPTRSFSSFCHYGMVECVAIKRHLIYGRYDKDVCRLSPEGKNPV